MLAVVSLLGNTKDENQGEMESFRLNGGSVGDGGGSGGGDEFPDFSDGLDSIDFDELFISINDGDVLPDLEMDPEILAAFSISDGGTGEEYSDVNKTVSFDKGEDDVEIEIVSKKRDESPPVDLLKENDKGRKSSKNVHRKRKVKVDWTPDLHRRFVQAVEQLGVDKAVPSRILELMGIDSLTRHNIASHLQKYRSHRRHLLAREAEASSWTQRRQMYGMTGAGGGGGKREMVPWVAPTMGFPPITAAMHHHHHPHHHFRPLHVWGHPSMDQSVMHMWPKHLAHSPSPPPHPPPTWAATPPPMQPPSDKSYGHLHHQRVPNALSPGTPCYPQAMPTMRFGAPPVPGIPPHAMYKVEPGIGVPSPQSGPHPIFDFQPSKESIDAAIGDILSKPWQPLPLGLKPPGLDSVMVELQRQGVPKIPPTCTA